MPSASPATSSSPGRLPAKSALRLCALPVLKGGDVDGPADGYGGAAERCEGLWKAPGNEFFSRVLPRPVVWCKASTLQRADSLPLAYLPRVAEWQGPQQRPHESAFRSD